MGTARLFAVLLLATATAAPAQPHGESPLDPMNAAIAAAERALAEHEPQIAESHYREALFAGWMAMGAIAAADGRFNDARDAFTHASTSIVESGDALQELAVVDLQLNDPQAALPILTRLAAIRQKDAGLKRLLAQALILAGKPAEAVQLLEEAHSAAPDDLETTFALATGELRAGKPDAARGLFTAIGRARPVPETYVLIGRAYRDAGLYADARSALRKALTMNPRVHHAYYYLGTVAVMDEGVIQVDEAIADFRRELALDPGDRASSLLLGIGLVEAHREREALPLLEEAAARPDADWRTYQFLGRCHLALGDAPAAVTTLRKALALSAHVPVESRIGNLPYELAQALRQTGDRAAADAEFKAAESWAVARAETHRSALERYLADVPDAPSARTAALTFDVGPMAKVKAATRDAWRAQTSTALARAYMNLGILQARAQRFARGADLLQEAAALDPTLPHLQYTLGVTCFNAQEYPAAAAALERAIVAEPDTVDARRMLALASLNTQAFARAAELLRDDAERDRDPSLQYAYGVALVHSGHADEAEALFSRLLSSHADDPELNVLVGEAHAEQGDFDGAIAALKRALALDPRVADANRSLGVIYMKQGRLPDAAAALRAGLAAHPDDLAARYTLATVLDMDNQPATALEELSRILHARPADAEARYLTGKILLAQGAAADAVQHLEIAVRLEPADANIHYQLGLAYQKIGRQADAEKEFEQFQALKQQRREGRR